MSGVDRMCIVKPIDSTKHCHKSMQLSIKVASHSFSVSLRFSLRRNATLVFVCTTRNTHTHHHRSYICERFRSTLNKSKLSCSQGLYCHRSIATVRVWTTLGWSVISDHDRKSTCARQCIGLGPIQRDTNTWLIVTRINCRLVFTVHTFAHTPLTDLFCGNLIRPSLAVSDSDVIRVTIRPWKVVWFESPLVNFAIVTLVCKLQTVDAVKSYLNDLVPKNNLQKHIL